MNVLFLTEAGAGIGLGHITRVKVIESFFKKSNLKTDLILFDRKDPGNRDEISWINDLSWLDKVNEYNTVIIDSYLAPISFFEKIRNKFLIITVIDDYNRIPYPADLLINPNVFFDRIDYSNQAAKCRGGKDFVLLRESFWNFRNEKVNQNQGNILVTLGGSDYRNLLPKIARLSESFDAITIICPEKEKMEILKKDFPKIEWKGRLSEKEMLNAYFNSEIVISGCGQSLHELAYLEKKTIGIRIDFDQDLNLEYYLSSGFLPRKINWEDHNLLDILICIIKDYQKKESEKSKFGLKINPENNMLNYLKLILQL